MSRFDSDVDFYEWLSGQEEPAATASCTDCGTDIAPSSNRCCDGCSDKRERWAAALETRLPQPPPADTTADARCVCGVRVAWHYQRSRRLACVEAARRRGLG